MAGNEWTTTTGRDTAWGRNVAAVRAWNASHGTPMAPQSASVVVGGEAVRVGAFVAYVRNRRRSGRLEPARAAELEEIPGWTWGPLRTGPQGHAARNEDIRRRRREGWTLTELAEEFGMSRQRVHTIAPDEPDPELHRARLAARRLERRQAFEVQRAALARRAGAA